MSSDEFLPLITWFIIQNILTKLTEYNKIKFSFLFHITISFFYLLGIFHVWSRILVLVELSQHEDMRFPEKLQPSHNKQKIRHHQKPSYYTKKLATAILNVRIGHSTLFIFSLMPNTCVWSSCTSSNYRLKYNHDKLPIWYFTTFW